MSASEITNLRKDKRYLEAYKMASEEYYQNQSSETASALFWVCTDMMKCPKEERNSTETDLLRTIRICYADIPQPSNIVKEAFGWFLYRYLSDKLAAIPSVNAREILVEFLKLGTEKPSRLYSSFLGLATKMATQFPDFHFVPFLRIWGLSNLLPEDKEARTDESGKRFPSLTERIAKALSYSALFHPEETLDPEMQQFNTRGSIIQQLIATQTSTAEVKRRKMTFVRFMSQDGTEYSTEVHTITNFQKISYKDIPNRLFSALLRKKEDGKLTIEAAVLSSAPIEEAYPAAIGYVEYIDLQHDHIHIYDYQSRHYIAIKSNIHPQVGTYVQFIPLIPKESNFKTAVITKILQPLEGPAAFGLRTARITHIDNVNHYCAWELLPSPDGSTSPIIEANTTTPSFTTGFLSKQLLQQTGIDLPKLNTPIQIIVFLKRGKDKQKRPYVVYYKEI